MTDLSRIIAVKPIIHYPREAQVGRTYLMTIDLQSEETFEWQYDEEEYPVYCKADSDLFNSQSIGEPVVILHRFGGSYGEAKFLLTAHGDEMEGEIRITLVNKWGVPIKTFQLSSISIKREYLSSSNTTELILNSEAAQEPSQKSTQEFYPASILLIGGSEDKVHQRQILQNFFQQAGGIDARIAVISFKSQKSVEPGEIYRAIFEEMDAREVQVINISMQGQSERFTQDSYLEECSGIFISSDDLGISVSDRDARIPSSDIQILEYGQLANSPLLDQIHRRLAERNIALAITGTAMDAVGDVMLTKIASGESPNPSLAEMERGLGLVPGVIYCSYFNNRNRMAQLLSALAQKTANIGLGIDEDTCALIEEDSVTFQVVGRGAITVIDQSDLTYSNFEDVATSDPSSLHNLRVHILSEGDRFNLRDKISISPQGQQSSNHKFSTLEQHNIISDTSPAIMLIGGKKDSLYEREFLNIFFNRSGGSQSHIGIIPAASRNPAAVAGQYRTIFEDMGATAITVIDIRDRSQGEDPAWRDIVELCTGIFITEGDQVRLCGLLSDTPLMGTIRQRVQLGEMTLGGAGAGAATMGHLMIAGGGSGESPNRSLVDSAIGLGFIPEIIIDTHFYARNRINRLLSILASCHDKIGVGIDQNTCLILERNMSFHVLGTGTVTVIDVNNLSYTNESEIMPASPISIHNIRLHLLGYGSGYDLTSRSPIRFEPSPRSSKSQVGAEAFQELQYLARNHESSVERAQALQRLSTLYNGTSEALQILKTSAQSDKSLTVRELALLEIKKHWENDSGLSQIECRLSTLHQLIKLISTNNSIIESQLSAALPESLLGHTVRSYEIQDAYNEGEIQQVGGATEIRLDIQGVECINNCNFRIPFSVKIDCVVNYAIYKADYYALDDHKTASISISELNDHYFDAEEEYPIHVEGEILFESHLDKEEFSELSEDEVHDLLVDADVSIESITSIEVIE